MSWLLILIVSYNGNAVNTRKIAVYPDEKLCEHAKKQIDDNDSSWIVHMYGLCLQVPTEPTPKPLPPS